MLDVTFVIFSLMSQSHLLAFGGACPHVAYHFIPQNILHQLSRYIEDRFFFFFKVEDKVILAKFKAFSVYSAFWDRDPRVTFPEKQGV